VFEEAPLSSERDFTESGNRDNVEVAVLPGAPINVAEEEEGDPIVFQTSFASATHEGIVEEHRIEEEQMATLPSDNAGDNNPDETMAVSTTDHEPPPVAADAADVALPHHRGGGGGGKCATRKKHKGKGSHHR
jgi:cell division septation protein DedD